jgi:hypothetical protein
MSKTAKQAEKNPRPPKGLQRWGMWSVDARRFATVMRAISKILRTKIPKEGMLIIVPRTEDYEALAKQVGDFLDAHPQTMQEALIAENARIAHRREMQRITRGGKPH